MMGRKIASALRLGYLAALPSSATDQLSYLEHVLFAPIPALPCLIRFCSVL